ncbi:hypothetical protein BGW37DRAFT_553211 [Umbelopsis sp. PMI_123]|nr:hypothetical protein BGW37DRAFT_553211 [Umbelopsis sp. PMI_123]
MPVTSRQQARQAVDEPDKSPNGPVAASRKNGYSFGSEQVWEDVPDGDLHKCLHQITAIVLSFDRKNILSQAQSQSSAEKWDISLKQIDQKIAGREYSNITEYKTDVDQLFKNTSQTLDTNSQDQLIALQKVARQLIQIETKRLNTRPPENSNNKTDPMDADNMDADTPMSEANNGANGVRSTSNVSDQENRKALFQVTPDGYVFSDMSKKPHWVGEPAETPKMPSNYQEVIIHPSPYNDQDAASLSQAVPNHVQQHRRLDRYEQRMVPVEMLDYGAFASFAPKYDSNSATISFESTYMAKTSKQALWEDQKRRAREFYGDSSIDAAWLKEQGFDVDAILESVKDSEGQSEATDDMAKAIEQNANLLKRLAQLQDERFALQGKSANNVNKEELKIAHVLEQRLQGAIAQVAPKDLVDANTLEHAMNRLPIKDPAYRGTLPPTKLFAFTTDEPRANSVSGLPGHPGARQMNVNNTFRNR